MATVSYTRRSVCAGGCHVTMHVSFNGGSARSIVFDLDEIRQPLNTFTQEQVETALLLVLKAHVAGMTRAQAATAMPNNTAVVVTL